MITGNGYNMGSIIQIDFSFYQSDKPHTVQLCPSRPLPSELSEEYWTFIRPYHLYLLYFTWSLIVHKRRFRNQSRITMILLLQHSAVITGVIHHCCSIPLTTSCTVGSDRCNFILAGIWFCNGLRASALFTVRITS